MSKNINNLVQIAKVLKEMKEERELHGVPKTLLSRYPEGSEGIVINEDRFIVLNSQHNGEVKNTDKVNKLKDANLKYNANFYLGTHETDEPDIIDETHNKSKLISEAYTEVSFLPKDIYSQAEFNQAEGKDALRSIIDRSTLSPNDFDDYRVSEPLYSSGNVYDEIYRCRCIFHDISGNEIVESLLIKAFKVSSKKDVEYSYKIISSENIKEQVEQLENKVSNDKTGELRSVFSNISSAEYDEIQKHIKEGISQYYDENSKKFYRLTRVDVKAIYCLRLKKNPITLSLLVDNSIIATLPTYYSMVAGDFNVFTCPSCNTLSSDASSYEGIKIHVDHDFTNIDEDMLGVQSPIGCTDCMERCMRCNAWHFKLKDYNNVISKDFKPIRKRRFLKSFSDKDRKSENYCSCKEYLRWVYDEMSYVNKNDIFYERIIDRFLTGDCPLVFVNYLTGETIAKYDDFINYLHEYLFVYLKKERALLKKYTELGSKNTNYENRKARVHDFVDLYLINENNEFANIKLEDYIKQAVKDFKKALADAFNTVLDNIKTASKNQIAHCNCCNSFYFVDKNSQGEMYYNSVKHMCCCCDEASSNNYKMWSRLDDGATFYKSKNKSVAVRTYQSQSGEEVYEKWLKSMLTNIIEKLKAVRVKEKI